jgi:hypothetical protein
MRVFDWENLIEVHRADDVVSTHVDCGSLVQQKGIVGETKTAFLKKKISSSILKHLWHESYKAYLVSVRPPSFQPPLFYFLLLLTKNLESES